MRGRVDFKIKFVSFLSRCGVGLLFLVLACSGSSGPGSLGDGGGGPVGGSNQAAGPVSIPAPSATTMGEVGWEEARIFCTNIPDPERRQVQCQGNEGAVPANAQLRLTVYPPGRPGVAPSVPPLVSLVQATANGDGTWSQMVTATSPQIIHICLLRGGQCSENVFLMVPPEGGQVNGTQSLRNLVVDPNNGNIWYALFTPKWLSPRWDWRSLFLSTAYAQEEAVLPTGVPAQCAAQSASVSDPASDSPQNAQLAGNRGCLRLHPRGLRTLSTFSNVLCFPGKVRDDIHGIVLFNVGGTDYVAVAVDSRVYILNVGDDARPVMQIIHFPRESVVKQLIDTGGSILALLGQREGGTPLSRPVYYIRKDPMGGFPASCMDMGAGTLVEITDPTQAEGKDGYLAVVGKNASGQYQVVVGATGEVLVHGGLVLTLPVTLASSPKPLEVNILQANVTNIVVAVLDSDNKTIQLIQYFWGSAADTARVTTIALESLRGVGVSAGSLDYPYAMGVNTADSRIAFVDVQERGSRILTFAYRETRDHGYGSVDRSLRETSIGTSTPTIVRWYQGHWAYNDFHGSLVQVITLAEQLGLDPDGFRQFNPDDFRDRNFPGL